MVASPTSTGRTDLDAALDVYERENGFAPTGQQGLDALQRRPGDAPAPPAYRAVGYIRRMPIDPWGQAYRYDPERTGRRVWSDQAQEHCPARDEPIVPSHDPAAAATPAAHPLASRATR